ncbi:MAG: hypothetical protein J6D52_09970 [Clostridia bacterium]|nr:hypothetical protein [Clostridia bacterium]
MKKAIAIFLLLILASFSGCATKEAKNNKFYKNDETINIENNSIKIGDIIKFGHWEQDGNYSNGEEEIEWIVLEVSNNKYLVLSKYVLSSDIYSYEKYATFEDNNITRFLNGTFLEKAFNFFERKKLVNGTITSSNGNYTPENKAFLLCGEEIEKYSKKIPSIYDCYPTDEAKKSLKVISNDKHAGKCYWWVRDNTFFGTVVSPDGMTWINTKQVDTPRGIRPSIWLDYNYASKPIESKDINKDFLGKWYVLEGNDKHTLTIFNNGKLSFDDGQSEEDLIDYTYYSTNEIEIIFDNTSYIFVLKEDALIRYEEGNSSDIYVYKKQ